MRLFSSAYKLTSTNTDLEKSEERIDVIKNILAQSYVDMLKKEEE
jgi:hypothetical protein